MSRLRSIIDKLRAMRGAKPGEARPGVGRSALERLRLAAASFPDDVPVEERRTIAVLDEARQSSVFDWRNLPPPLPTAELSRLSRQVLRQVEADKARLGEERGQLAPGFGDDPSALVRGEIELGREVVRHADPLPLKVRKTLSRAGIAMAYRGQQAAIGDEQHVADDPSLRARLNTSSHFASPADSAVCKTEDGTGQRPCADEERPRTADFRPRATDREEP